MSGMCSRMWSLIAGSRSMKEAPQSSDESVQAHQRLLEVWAGRCPVHDPMHGQIQLHEVAARLPARHGTH